MNDTLGPEGIVQLYLVFYEIIRLKHDKDDILRRPTMEDRDTDVRKDHQEMCNSLTDLSLKSLLLREVLSASDVV